MDVSDIVSKLIKIFAENYAKTGKTEFPVAGLLSDLQNVDLTSLLSAVKTLQSQGLVSLLGSDNNAIVKLIPEALAQIDKGDLLHKGLDMLSGLFKKN